MSKKTKKKTILTIDMPKHYPITMKNPKRFGFIWDATIIDLND